MSGCEVLIMLLVDNIYYLIRSEKNVTFFLIFFVRRPIIAIFITIRRGFKWPIYDEI